MRYVRVDPERIDRSNILVVAPTGSGKTTATLNALGSLLFSPDRKWRRAVFTVPTLAIAREVYKRAVDLYGRNRVGIATSEAKVEKGWTPREYDKPILVTTYEVLDSLLLSSPGKLDRSIIVIDEIHQITSRTTTIQSILANTKYLVKEKGLRIRVVGLSATIPDIDELAEYLEAEVITHGVRPVKIEIDKRIVDEPPRRGLWSYVSTKLSVLREFIGSL